MRTLKSLLLLAVASILLATPAIADTITLTLLNPSQNIGPGQTVTFNATVTASSLNTGDIFLNQDSINVTDGVDNNFVPDDSDFFANFPFFLAPGDSVTDALFTITNIGTIAEAYTGSFVLQGGANGDASDILASATFGSPITTSPVPEPSSLLLIGTGVVGLASFGRRRLRA